MPRDYIRGGVVDFNGGTQKCSWGAILTSSTVITCSFILNLRGAGSASFDTIWGYSQQRWFFILSGSTTRRLSFNVLTTIGEKSSGVISSNLLATDFYTIVGQYDPAGGTNNILIEAYSMPVTGVAALYSSNSATVTGSFAAVGNSLVAGYDSIRALPVNAQMKNFRVWSRILTSNERQAVAANNQDGWSRANLDLETLCNESSGTSLRDTTTVANQRPGTLSGGATLSQNVPPEFALSRQLIV